MARAADPARGDSRARHVLITQCLQNDFLLNRDCRLYVADRAARSLLLGPQRELPNTDGRRLRLDRRRLERGPLGSFLDATIGARMRGAGQGTLHVINVRDWHVAGHSYDLERQSYGPHCEAGTWGAAYVEGLTRYLDPAGGPPVREAEDTVIGGVHIHHVHSDSVFDFRPRCGECESSGGRFPPSKLERILDELVAGSDADGTADNPAPLYVAVIGVYTDIKVLTLLAGLRTRYDLHNLATSDSLTASPTLERHIAGLDFCVKILGVEVFHGINDLVRFLGGPPSVEDESELVGPDSFARYRGFFQDKQSVLAAESERLKDYVALTERRALETFAWIRLANYFLIGWGSAFLVATLVFAILSGAGVGQFSWKLPAITGGLSLLQIVGAFYSKPMADLQRNLANLAVFKMVLESRSLKTAFARFHLTTPQVLRELQDEKEERAALRQVGLLERELALIQGADDVDFAALERLGFTLAGEDANGDGGAVSPGTDMQSLQPPGSPAGDAAG